MHERRSSEGIAEPPHMLFADAIHYILFRSGLHILDACHVLDQMLRELLLGLPRRLGEYSRPTYEGTEQEEEYRPREYCHRRDERRNHERHHEVHEAATPGLDRLRHHIQERRCALHVPEERVLEIAAFLAKQERPIGMEHTLEERG